MKLSKISAPLLAASVLLTPNLSLAQNASSETSFVCGQVDGVPATIARVSQRSDVVMIRWTKDMGDYNPKTRCQMVSNRFQSAFSNKNLRYITSGMINGQRVICVAETQFSGCATNGLLFTLRPKDDSKQILNNLLKQSRYASTAPVIVQNCISKKDYGSKSEVAIALEEFLYQCPVSRPEELQ